MGDRAGEKKTRIEKYFKNDNKKRKQKNQVFMI